MENALEELGFAADAPKQDVALSAMTVFASAAIDHTAETKASGHFQAAYTARAVDFGRTLSISVTPRGTKRVQEAVAPFDVEIPSHMLTDEKAARLVMTTLDSVVERMFRAQWKTL